MDYIGPISPACPLTSAAYIIIAVDYFTRFIWAKAYPVHTQHETLDFLETHVTPAFGWPAALYTDNGGHFVLPLLKKTYEQHGVAHYTTSITKPSAVGLIERNVQLIILSLRNCCTAAGTTYDWTCYLTAAVNAVNTRLMRAHGYSLAELLLGYNPRLLHVGQFASDARRAWLAAQVPPEAAGVRHPHADG